MKPLKLYNMSKIRNRKKQEDQLTLTVGVIFLVYIFCNLPASIVLLVDPTATKYTKVLTMFPIITLMLLLFRLTYLATL